MIIAYRINEKKALEKIILNTTTPIPDGTIWIDLLEPSQEEEKFIESSLKIDAPTREEIDKIEVMSPFYKEDNAYFVTITAIHKIENHYPEGTAIIFILHADCLVTLRYAEPKAFNYFTNRAMRNPKIYSTPVKIFEGLFQTIVHDVADILEKTGNDIDQLLIDVFEKPKDYNGSEAKKSNENWKEQIPHSENTAGNYYTNIIKRVGRTGNLISKIRECLVSVNRTLIFFDQIEEFKFLSKKNRKTSFKNLTREIYSLTEYANFLTQRNGFLLDATLGMINVEQSMIIKVFTVAAAVFLPPTLIASIYGMNFEFMPELHWKLGYPFSLLLIVLSGILPYYYFKRKGWL